MDLGILMPVDTLSVDSRVEHLAEIADFVQHAARAAGLDDKQAYDVQMAVDEACTNVIEHAYHGRKNGTIEITCERRGKDFVVLIQDYGDAFNPARVARPNIHDPLARRRVGGLGLFFMNKLMDSVDFKFSARNGNRLTMVKRIKRSK